MVTAAPEYSHSCRGMCIMFRSILSLRILVPAVYGMNDRIGTLSFPKKEEHLYDKPYSEATAQVIDEEVRCVG